MLVLVMIVATLLVGAGWVFAELRSGTRVRVTSGLLLIACSSTLAWAMRDLQYRQFTFWVTQALEEVSQQVGSGRGESIHTPISEFVAKVRHDPSTEAAFELVRDLKPETEK